MDGHDNWLLRRQEERDGFGPRRAMTSFEAAYGADEETFPCIGEGCDEVVRHPDDRCEGCWAVEQRKVQP